MRKTLIISIVISAFIITIPCRASVLAQSGPEKVALLEVYSSEGCSSCPPAEEWVSRLKKDPDLWKEYVPVVFHVDYWDRLGWKDKFSDARFTERQQAYSTLWGSRDIYTPGFVLDGKEWRDWSRYESINLNPKESAGILSIEKEAEGSYKIIFLPAGDLSSKSFTIHAALLGFDMVSDVKAGENAGRRIRHDFTVIDYEEKESETEKDGHFEAKVRLKIPDGFSVKKTAISAWVSDQNDPRALQTVGGFN